MPHAVSRTTMVRMAVARLESMPSTPIFASMDVAAANTAERIAKTNHIESIYSTGFPKDFILPENMSDAKLYIQAGNSVCVSVIERIAEKNKRSN